MTAGTLDMLGARPALGRALREDEDFSGNIRVTILGERLWRGRFGADPVIVGRTLEIDGQRAEVIGILPQDFGLPVDQELWFPMDFAMPTADARGSGRSFAVVGRFHDGASVEVADAEARVLFVRIWGPRESDTVDQSSARVFPLADRYVGPAFSWLLVLTGLAAAAVLLVASANVATLALAKALARRIDIAVRTALGAGRVRIALHFAVESLVLAVPGTLMGVWLAAIGLAVFKRFEPELGLPYWADLRIDTQYCCWPVRSPSRWRFSRVSCRPSGGRPPTDGSRSPPAGRRTTRSEWRRGSLPARSPGRARCCLPRVWSGAALKPDESIRASLMQG